ncbi:MAG: TonB-dependent receptor, partial [Pseudomonadales bacterium]|nr:TonB-dependent receptor [Pseudomonadales bacterium]
AKAAYDITIAEKYRVVSSLSYLYSNKVSDLEFGGAAMTAPDTPVLRIVWPDTKANVRIEWQNINVAKLSWSTGLEFTQYKIPDARFLFLPSTDYIPSAYAGLERNVFSAWFNSTYWFNEKYSVIAGLRADKYDDIDDTTETPRLGFIYQPRTDTAIKLLYAQAFRAPGATEQAGSTSVLGSFDIKPEVIDTFEWVLMKNSAFYRSNITVFTSKWTDGIAIEKTADSIAAEKSLGEYVNTGKNSARGIEFEVDVYFMQGSLAFKTSGSYIKSKNDKDNTDYVAFPTIMFNWGVIYTAAHQTWVFSMMNHFEAGRKAYPSDAAKELDNYYRTDISATWQPLEKLALAVNIIDIFDAENINPSAWARSKGLAEPGFDASLSARYSF